VGAAPKASEEGGYRAAVRLLRADEPPSAIFAVNDISCVSALSAVDELGSTVPQQLSLAGYDDTTSPASATSG
jgi:DNA-binding LacI/PurR family transcriptional regulator